MSGKRVITLSTPQLFHLLSVQGEKLFFASVSMSRLINLFRAAVAILSFHLSTRVPTYTAAVARFSVAWWSPSTLSIQLANTSQQPAVKVLTWY